MTPLPKVVAMDANTLVCACGPQNLEQIKLFHLLDQVGRAKGRVLIPAPAIAEFLVYADQAALGAMEILQNRSSVMLPAFDLAAAFEVSLLDGSSLRRGDKRDGSDRPWQKIKVDRQLVAISKVHGAQLIVSDDGDVRAAAARCGIRATSVDALPIPDSARQHPLPIGEHPAPEESTLAEGEASG